MSALHELLRQSPLMPKLFIVRQVCRNFRPSGVTPRLVGVRK
jgi:hypothetical protein